MNPVEWLFRNQHTGDIVMGQAPNAPISIFTVSAVAHWLFPDDAVGRVAGGVSRAALAWWAVDEVLRGANPYRRLLGAGALVLLLVRVIR